MLQAYPLFAQQMTTMGTDFWVCFLKNATIYTNPSNAVRNIFVSGEQNCDVTVTNPMTGWSHTGQVTANSVTTIDIPVNQSWNTTSETLTDMGFHVTSTGRVSVYAGSSGLNTYDVTNVLPTTALRDEYMIVTYPSDRFGSEFAIVATEDSTWVDVYLSSSTQNGVPAGDTLTILLPHAGQVYQIVSATVGDFTGSRVKSRDCKPIAVFHGDVCVYVPGFANGMTCDLAFEQAVPPVYWGRKFVVPHFSSTHADYVRVASLRDSCKVYRNGLYMTTLNAGEVYSFQGQPSDSPIIVTSSQPVSVNVFFASVGGSGTGDPSMLTVTPIEQMVHNITFACHSTPYTTTHKINVVLKTTDVPLFNLDGLARINNFVPVLTDASYSNATFTVSQGRHTLTMSNDGDGFVAFVYGMGQHESYVYSVGSRLKDLGSAMIVNGEYVAEGDTVDACVGSPFTFSTLHGGSLNYIVWDIGDAYVVGDTVARTYNTEGVRRVVARLFASGSDCFAANDTLTAYVNIHGSDTTDLDTSVCRNPFVWYGGSITESGVYEHVLENAYGCDSLLRLDVDLWSMTPTEIAYEGCDSIVVDDVVYTVGIRMSDTLLTADGCDSIVNTKYTIHPSYDLYDHRILDEGDTLTWIDGNRYWNEEQHPYVVYGSKDGCDSIVRLRLDIIPHVAPPPEDSSRLWIPNAFTPDEETNPVFKVECCDIDEIHVTVFNRQGLYVTEFDGLTGWWDGTCRGTKCKQETFVYLVEYRTKAMPSITQKRIGTVALLR